ncbi:MAG: redox-regulated ATPase YchF [Candidatus Dormibacteria bacterium]
MGLSIGIVGLPNVGKSTLFNALTRAGALVANYPFATIDPNTGVVEVPDARLDRLTEVFKPEKRTPAAVTFVDIAGLVKGASEGEGLGNQFLGHIRECDAIAMVVRCFEDDNVTHVGGRLDPRGDIEVVDTELMLADMDGLQRRLEKTRKAVDQKREKDIGQVEVLQRVLDGLNAGIPARRLGLTEEEKEMVRDLSLLSLKPVIYIANVSETDAARTSGGGLDVVAEVAKAEGGRWLPISARIESELQELGPEDAREFLDSIGLAESGLGRLAREAFEMLGLATFLTAGDKECRAWTIRRGTRAPQAAGVIHTDFERGFIKAEVADWKDLVELGSWTAAKAQARVRIEGKEYVFQDGDTVIFRFNV